MSARGRRHGATRLAGLAGWLALSWLVCGCGQQAGTPTAVCRDRVSGNCYPCPGTVACIDPVKCTLIECGDAVAFVTDISKADTSKADASKEDAGSGDAKAQVQDAGPDVPDSAPDVPDTIADVPCSAGQKQCNGNVVQLCVSTGVWVDQGACPAGQACGGAGVCGCGDPCPAVGLVQCLPDVPAVKTCQLGGDKCLAWGVPVACKPGEVCELGVCKAPTATCNPPCPGGQVCQNGQCVAAACNPPCPGGQACQNGQCVVSACDPPCDGCHVCQNGQCLAGGNGGGSLSCAQVTACIGNCAVGDATCPADCKSKGTCAAQATFGAFKDCITATCKSLAEQGKQNEALFCIYQYCGKEQAACVGSGSGTCSQLNDCLNGCGGSATCTSGCNTSASQQAALDFYGLMTCVDNNCAGKAGDAQVQCAQSACSAQYQKCLGGSTGGGTLTSCYAIAQCQQGCGGDTTCAKGCTAKGTPQAQADVNAFIDCRDNKCGAWCVNASNPQCGDCVTQYCAAQLAACSP